MPVRIEIDERKQQNGPGRRGVDRDVVRGSAAGVEREIENQFAAGICHADSENPANDGEQRGLDQRLSHQAAARRAESDAQGGLRTVLQSAGEHEIGEVAAGYQEHTSGRDEQQL